MKRLGDWNTVATVTEGHYEFVGQWLTRFGPVAGTDYYNVLVMRVDDTAAFPEALRAALAAEPTVAPGIGRIVPLTETFGFQNVEAFERQACHGVRRWFDALRGKRFHVRMHRRGFRGRLLSQHEELFLDHFVMDALAGADRLRRARRHHRAGNRGSARRSLLLGSRPAGALRVSQARLSRRRDTLRDRGGGT